jgi:hypothetical protein
MTKRLWRSSGGAAHDEEEKGDSEGLRRCDGEVVHGEGENGDSEAAHGDSNEMGNC